MKKILIVIVVILAGLSLASVLAVKTGFVEDAAKGYIKGESLEYIEQRKIDGIAHSKKLMDKIKKENYEVVHGVKDTYKAKSNELRVLYAHQVATLEEKESLGKKTYDALSIIMNRFVNSGMSVEEAKEKAYAILKEKGYFDKKPKELLDKDGLPTKSLSQAMSNLYKRAMADESINEEAKKQVEVTDQLVENIYK